MNSRKKIINELRFQLDSKEVKDQHYPVQLSASDANAILSLLKEREWISVKDRLPEGDGELYYDNSLENSNIVMLYGKDPYGRRTFGIGFWVYDHSNTKNSCWNGVMDDDWEAYLCTVTHWMPLPEPPKEGDGE